MARPRRLPLLVVLLGVSFATPFAAQIEQIVITQSGQSRDVPPPQPQERRIPVGTSSLAGTVTAADTGRPIVGARIMLSGQILSSAGAVPPGRGAAPVPVAPMSGIQAGLRGGNPPGIVGGLSRSVVTDQTGSFIFERLPAGQFHLSVSHSQYLAMNYGQRRYGGQGATVPLADGEKATLKITMERGAVITGTVIAQDGEPQRHAQVRLMRYTRNNGVRRLQAQNAVGTDDRGVYRVFGLQPGDYLIAATPNPSDAMNMERFNAQNNIIERAIADGPVTPPGRQGGPAYVTVTLPPQSAINQAPPPPLYLPTYAPGATSPAEATVVTVKAGEERTSVDVVVNQVTSTTVQVELTSPPETGVNVQYNIINDDPAGSSSDGGQRRDQNNRVFFMGLHPGKYTVIVQTVPAPVAFVQGQPRPAPVLAPAQKMFASVPVEVNGEQLIAVSATLRPARTVSGRVIFNTTRPADLTRSNVTVTLNPAPLGQGVFFDGPQQAQVNADGTFTITGVIPGRYTLRANGAGGYLRSSSVAGQDTLDIPLEFTGERDITDAVLTMADSASSLVGTLTDASGRPVFDYTLVVASTDTRYWLPGTRRITTIRPGPDGHYSISSLPPGSYFLAAVQDLEFGAQFDPEFLRELLPASVPVTIVEGGKTTQDLRVR